MATAPLAPALAQAEIRASVNSFAPDYFAETRPPSALEMVRLLPGFSLVEGDATVRGYSGAVGNVLIDGRPPASKQDKLEDILKRIPIASVERVELIRPGAGIDMQGHALLANVVRRASTALHGHIESELRFFPQFGLPAARLALELSMGTTEVLDVSASVSRAFTEAMGGVGARIRTLQDGSLLRATDTRGPRYTDSWNVSASWRQPLLGGKLRLTAQVKDAREFTKTLEHQTFPALAPIRGVEFVGNVANEATMQYDRGLWSGASMELIAIRRGSKDHNNQTYLQAGTDSTFRAAHSSESVLRGALRQSLGSVLLEAGAESAINTLDNTFSYTSGGVSITLPGANVRITERRSEFFGTATWRPDADLTLETGVRYEMSSLKQQGDIILDKTLGYLKPRALVNWKIFADDEVRLLYERQAGQLDFVNFVPDISLTSGQVTVGNANLEPYTLWNMEFAWEHRFANASLVLTARRQEISNVVDRVPVVSPLGTFDGVGNLGNGRRDEFQIDFLLPLDMLSLPDVTLQGTALRRFSKVTDPTTGLLRHISSDQPVAAKISLTHNLPELNARWGLTYTHSIDRWQYKFNEIRHDRTAEAFDAFVEYKPSDQWLIRLFGKNLLDRPVRREREIYRGPRGVAPLNYFERRDALIGSSVGITVQRAFGE